MNSHEIFFHDLSVVRLENGTSDDSQNFILASSFRERVSRARARRGLKRSHSLYRSEYKRVHIREKWLLPREFMVSTFLTAATASPTLTHTCTLPVSLSSLLSRVPSSLQCCWCVRAAVKSHERSKRES